MVSTFLQSSIVLSSRPRHWEYLTLKHNKYSTHAHKWDTETNSRLLLWLRLVREDPPSSLSPLFHILLCSWNQDWCFSLLTLFRFDSLLLEVRTTWRRGTFEQDESSEYRWALMQKVTSEVFSACQWIQVPAVLSWVSASDTRSIMMAKGGDAP